MHLPQKCSSSLYGLQVPRSKAKALLNPGSRSRFLEWNGRKRVAISVFTLKWVPFVLPSPQKGRFSFWLPTNSKKKHPNQLASGYSPESARTHPKSNRWVPVATIVGNQHFSSSFFKGGKLLATYYTGKRKRNSKSVQFPSEAWPWEENTTGGTTFFVYRTH